MALLLCVAVMLAMEALLTSSFQRVCRPWVHGHLMTLKISENAVYFPDTSALRPFSSSASSLEKDYLGPVNFCLRNNDGALTGPSRSKVLNEITNDVFKAIMIGFDPFTDEVISKLPNYRDIVSQTVCKLDSAAPLFQENNVPAIESCDDDLTIAMKYVDWLEDLLQNGTVHESVLGGVYDQGYRRLLTYLRDSGCLLGHAVPSAVEPAAQHHRPKPADKDICLSIIDNTLLKQMPDYASRTTELNHLANVVARTMLYGGHRERARIADLLSSVAADFAHRWNIVEEDGNGQQEQNFLQVLILLLRQDLAAAEKASNPVIVANGEGSRVSTVCKGANTGAGAGAGAGAGTRAGTAAVVPTVPSYRLYDAYENAFHRVVEMCILEAKSDFSPTQTDEMWLSFLQWEQGLRSELTQDLWNLHPAELVGEWELVDVSGAGNLQTIMTAPTDMLFADAPAATVLVEFTKEGKVHLKRSNSEGESWSFKPGPAHLDTCEFTVRSGNKPNLQLRYVGFIDRGQFIESRFSKLPIRMTGRVLSVVDGQPQGSSRFGMKLQRK